MGGSHVHFLREAVGSPFYRAKGPFQNLASAQKHVDLFMLGFVFETFSAEAAAERQGRCPLQVAG